MTAPIAPIQEPQGLITPEAAAYDAATVAQTGVEEETKRALRAMYGPAFPLLKDNIEEKDWSLFAEDRWSSYGPGCEDAVHRSRRNRMFAEGRHYISARSKNGSWREPPAPKDAIRAVYDMTGPALDYRLQVITEQRPGWKFTPANMDSDRQRKAEARQRFVEYQWHAQGMQEKGREAAFWAQRDGVSFLMDYWDGDKGESDDVGPLGDVDTKVYRIEQVRVAPNATATESPVVWVIKEVIPKMSAIDTYGIKVLDAEDSGNSDVTNYAAWRSNERDDDQTPLFTNHEMLDRLIVYIQPNAFFPDGLCVVTVGQKVVYGPMALPFKKVPMVRVSDGSPSPLFYSPANMDRWIAPQMRINMIVSKWCESVRRNAGGQFLAKLGAVSTETMVAGLGNYIEVRSHGNIDDLVKAIPGFSIGNDTKELLDREIQAFENLSGWDDNARGSFSGDQSGRAILAIREQLERALAPSVNAMAFSYSQWAEHTVEWGRWGWTVPRTIGVVGQNRPDLAREITQDDLGGVVNVYVDPTTLVPMPNALKQYLLEDALQKGVIDIREYRRRMPFANVQDFATPNDIQEAKAKRVCEQIRFGVEPEPIVWQDDEAIHQTVLEAEIILSADSDPMWQQKQMVAQQRWTMLAQQSSMKMGVMAPPPAPGQPGQEGLKMDPSQQPLLGTSPSVPAAPVAQMEGQADKSMAAQLSQGQPPK